MDYVAVLVPSKLLFKSYKKRAGKFCVYILECIDNTHFTSYTNDLERRIKDHISNKWGAKYTRYKRPVNSVWKNLRLLLWNLL